MSGMEEARNVLSELEKSTETDLTNGITASITTTKRGIPNSYLSDPSSLTARDTTIHSLSFGTGGTLYKNLLPHLLAANHEILLVTCFWYNPCPTLTSLSQTLIQLSRSRQAQPNVPPLRVRICLSSLSLWQKLFTPRKSYRTAEIGLPSEDELPGLDIKIKSLFYLPFSVMHPKFVVIDRKKIWVPSCNVSWEEWFEGAVLLSGSQITEQSLRFYSEVWSDQEQLPTLGTATIESKQSLSPLENDSVLASRNLDQRGVRTIFLPSSHHLNPLTFKTPKTPLNIYTLSLFAHAKTKIYIQTPNLTSPPVLSGLKDALKRGVEVEILTSERLMILEQLVTALTTTSRCIKKLIKWYNQIKRSRDLERDGKLGNLKIAYYQRHKSGTGPVQSHLKLTVVDDRIAVLGSGNMDRASWFTSQELGVSFISTDFVTQTMSALNEAMEGRRKVVYDSTLS